MKDEKDVLKLAEDHYIYLESVTHKTYVDAFIHGYKHGKNDKNE